MTVPEVLSVLDTNTPKGVGNPIPRLDVPPFPYHSEGLHGLRNSYDTMGLNATLFPQTTALAASGNMSLIQAMADVMGVEARGLANTAKAEGKMFPRGAGLFYWSPTMNLGVDPRWGRAQESISGDPFLNAQYSVAFLNGFQTTDARYHRVAATCKHLMAYSLEGVPSNAPGGNSPDAPTRHNFNAIVSNRDFNETYITPFATCVKQGAPGQVMCSYPSLNSVPNCAHHDTLTTILRDEWGYENFVVSDQGAIANIFEPFPQGHGYQLNQTRAIADAINAGCDQNDGALFTSLGASAIAAGDLTDTTVRTAAKRIMRVRFLIGEFDPPSMVPWTNLGASDLDTDAHRALAKDAGRQSMVLLRNRAGVLPLSSSSSSAKSFALVGPFANNTEVFLGGKPDYHPSFIVSIEDALAAQVGAKNLVTEVGCSVSGSDKSGFDAAVKAATNADVTVLVVGIDGTIEHEGVDRPDISLPGVQPDLVEAIVAAAKTLVVVFVNGGSVSNDAIAAKADTVVEAFQPGEWAGAVIVELLFGAVNPSASLPYTVFAENYVTKINRTSMDMRQGAGRTYRFLKDTPLWPFGYGESFTTFTVTASSDDESTVPTHAFEGQQFTVTVTNTGKVAGARVVHAFSSRTPDSRIRDPPLKSLCGLTKVFLHPGESTDVTFPAGDCFVSVLEGGQRGLFAGEFRLQVGGDGRPASFDNCTPGSRDATTGWICPTSASFTVKVTGQDVAKAV